MNDSSADHWFEIRKEKAVAFGKAIGKQFLVRAGSAAVRDGSPEEKRDRPKRDALVDEGVLVPSDDAAIFVFCQDYLFSSKSLAAGVVIDGNSNGSHWRTSANGGASDTSPPTLAREQVKAATGDIDMSEVIARYTARQKAQSGETC